MKIAPVKIYSNNLYSRQVKTNSVSPFFKGTEKGVINKNSELFFNACKFKNYVGDKFSRNSNVLQTKKAIFHRFNAEFDEICNEHKVTRLERESLIAKFDINSLKKETELVLDENKKLRHVYIRNTEDDTKSLKFDFENEQLTCATYAIDGKKIKLDINSSDFEKTFWHPSDFDFVTAIMIGDFDLKKLKNENVLTYLKSLNNIIYGKMPRNLQSFLEEYEDKFEGKKIYVDHNVEPVVVKNCIELFDKTPFDEIPKTVVLTNFLEDDTDGLYCQGEDILLRPTRYKDSLSRRLYHETQHRKDYLTGKPLGQTNSGLALMFNHKILHDMDGQILADKIDTMGNRIVFEDTELKELIKNKISDYATTNSGEFIAEFGAMMRRGIIGVWASDKGNILYSIKKNYKNEDMKPSTISKEEFKTLLQTYLLLGGTPEFNNVIFSKDALLLAQQEVFLSDKN